MHHPQQKRHCKQCDRGLVSVVDYVHGHIQLRVGFTAVLAGVPPYA